MKILGLVIFCCSMIFTLLLEGSAHADEAGQVLAVKKQVSVIRDKNLSSAKPRMTILMKDAVATGPESRTKLFFKDDSILNLGELSKVEVEKYMYMSENDRTSSIYKLIDGSLRVVVGRSDLEVHTTTAVAAARGTKFIIWTEHTDDHADKDNPGADVLLASNASYPVGLIVARQDKALVKRKSVRSCIQVLEGDVLFKNINSAIKGALPVGDGKTACVPVDGPPVFAGNKTAPSLYVLGETGESSTILPAFIPGSSPDPDPEIILPMTDQQPTIEETSKQGDFELLDKSYIPPSDE